MITSQPNYQIQNAQGQEEVQEGFNLMDFYLVLLAHWYWIVIAVVIALTIAIVKVNRTTPSYTRSMSLLIKSDDGKNGSLSGSSMSQEFQNLGIIPNSNNINNEIQTISAPVMMQEVVRRLHIDVQMNVEEGMHTVPLYDDSPITLLLPQASDDYMCSFKMILHPNQTAELWDFEDEKGVSNQRVAVKMGQLSRTPVGFVLIQPTKFWGKNVVDKEIFVNKYPVEAVGDSYAQSKGYEQFDQRVTLLSDPRNRLPVFLAYFFMHT